MRTIRVEQSKGLWRKICVSCGYDGSEVRGDLEAIGYRCPQCDQDLYARPPQSYAEMEGFEPVTVYEESDRETDRPPARTKRSPVVRLVNWVGSLFGKTRTR